MGSPELDAIRRRHGVLLLLQHGSSVSGRTHEKSDVDIAALFGAEAGFERQNALLGDLQLAFPGETVDLAPLNHADPLFLRKVLERCRLLAGSERRLAELRLYAFRRYQDHRHFLQQEEEYVRRFVDERVLP